MLGKCSADQTVQEALNKPCVGSPTEKPLRTNIKGENSAFPKESSPCLDGSQGHTEALWRRASSQSSLFVLGLSCLDICTHKAWMCKGSTPSTWYRRVVLQKLSNHFGSKGVDEEESRLSTSVSAECCNALSYSGLETNLMHYWHTINVCTFICLLLAKPQ